MSTKLPIVAVIGRANVGKSSLCNRLLGERRSIVDDEAGTTRDSVVSRLEIGSKAFWLVDTAGYKQAEDELEISIQQQLDEATHTADVLLLVVEANIPPTSEDRLIAKKALKTKKPVILVVNKMDKAKRSSLDEFKKLGVKQTVFTSAVHYQGFDELEELLTKNLPSVKIEAVNKTVVALIGRPNVGKSMILNSLTGQPRAVVSDKAGTTRDINRLEVDYRGHSFEVLDTAGIRPKSKTRKSVEYFSSLRTISAIEQSNVCVLVMDATEPNTKFDMKIAGLVKEAGKGLILVLNKWDLIEADEKTFDLYRGRTAKAFEFVAWAPLVVTSAQDSKNIFKLLEIASDIVEQSTKQVATPELNRWLTKVVSSHQPAGLKNSHPRLKYAVQTGSAPPTFRFFGSSLKLLHWSYKRYLEKQLRQEFEIFGTAVRLEFRDGAPKDV